jgi:hypothetical protein
VLRRIFGPKRGEVTGDWKKLHNEELHNLYSSPNIIRLLHTQYMQSLMQLKILFILTLTRYVSAAVGHHQVFLLKLFHCNFYV